MNNLNTVVIEGKVNSVGLTSNSTKVMFELINRYYGNTNRVWCKTKNIKVTRELLKGGCLGKVVRVIGYLSPDKIVAEAVHKLPEGNNGEKKE